MLVSSTQRAHVPLLSADRSHSSSFVLNNTKPQRSVWKSNRSLVCCVFPTIGQHGASYLSTVVNDSLRSEPAYRPGTAALDAAVAGRSPRTVEGDVRSGNRQAPNSTTEPPEETVHFYDDDGQSISTMGSPREVSA